MQKVENHYQKHVVVSTNNTKNREQLEKYVVVFYYLKKIYKKSKPTTKTCDFQSSSSCSRFRELL